MSGPLRLARLKPIGRGGFRICFPHPDYPGRCVKVLVSNVPGEIPERSEPAGLRALLGRPADENSLEYQTYQDLERTGNPAVWDHVPRCHGMVETDFGPGLVTDLILSPDGTPAPTVARRVERGYDASCRRALEELKGFLLEHLPPVGDLSPSNLLIGVCDRGERERIYIVDGLAGRHFLWWRCFHPLRPFKVRRKIRRMELRIQGLLAQNARVQPS